MCQVSGVLGKGVDGHAEHHVIKESPVWTSFPRERLALRERGTRGRRGGDRTAGCVVGTSWGRKERRRVGDSRHGLPWTGVPAQKSCMTLERSISSLGTRTWGSRGTMRSVAVTGWAGAMLSSAWRDGACEIGGGNGRYKHMSEIGAIFPLERSTPGRGWGTKGAGGGGRDPCREGHAGGRGVNGLG